MRNYFLVCALLAVLSSAIQTQTPFIVHGDDGGSSTLVTTLAQLAPRQFTTIRHPAKPNYSVRIRPNGGAWCDNTVKSYTGYIDVDARHLFFLFFESRNDPKKDDVMLWINGGPGGSSSLGLLQELGPCTLKGDNVTEVNPYSWTSHANVFFLDQPVGVGFSYAEHGISLHSTKEAAKDVVAFMRIFFDTFSEFKGRRLHLTGESYGGIYLPMFGAAIYDDNNRAVAAKLEPINLVSLMIGNGCTGMASMIMSYYDFQCTGASLPPFQDITTCIRMKKALPRCRHMLKTSCLDLYDEMGCSEAFSFCSTELDRPFYKTNRILYDVSKFCTPDMLTLEGACIPGVNELARFLNNETLRGTIGADPAAGNYSPISFKVNSAFSEAGDMINEEHSPYIAQLLERGIRVLIYVGTYDMACNWVGNERMTLALEWSGQEAFVSQPMRDWFVNDIVVGKTRSWKGLTFATIDGAGHMAPADKPKESLEMVKRWLNVGTKEEFYL